MGAQGRSSVPSNSLRVKVYRLDDERWDDRGTGHVRVDFIEGSEDLGLIVVDEEDSEALLVNRISPNCIFRRQEDTIISWRDSELATEVALSFQEATGCTYICEQISGVQRNLQFNDLGDLEVGPRPPMETLEASAAMQSNGEPFHAISGGLRDLPPVELSNLPLILKMVLECGMTDQMHITELILQDREFFPKLLEVFRMCEDLENMDDLHMTFKLVKGIIMLNSPQIFEKIFGEEYILDIIGILEYDPDIHPVQQHRAFLKEHVVFKEAVPIKDSSVLLRIHQTYKIGYIKDVILPRILDEATIASLNSIIHANNAVVISLLKDDITFIQELFARMRSTSTSTKSKRDLVLLLHEFCSLSKSLPLVQQLRLFRDLASQGIFDVIIDVLQSQDRRLVSAGTDILILFLNQDPNLLRSYVVLQEENSLLGILVKGIATEFGEEMHSQFLEIIRILLDSYGSGPQRDTIVEIFYDKHLDQLIDVLASSCPPRSNCLLVATSMDSIIRAESHATAGPEVLSNICELLCFCVTHHPYRIKCNFLMNNAIEKVLYLTRRREKFLVVAAVRFMRSIISRNDEQLLRHIVKNNLMLPIIDAFAENGDRYNMLHSGVLELLEYVRKENIKTLVICIIECFWEHLSRFHHLATIQALKIKYDQLQESSEMKYTSTVGDRRKMLEERALEKEEEEYFNDDRSGSVGLVDYDDDDDEDYNPPPKKTETTLESEENITFPKIKRKAISTTNKKNEKHEIVKKPKMDIRASDGKVAHSTSTSNKCDPLCKKVETKVASQPTNNHSPDAVVENKQLNGDDGPTSLGTERVINGKNVPGSVPYSVR